MPTSIRHRTPATALRRRHDIEDALGLLDRIVDTPHLALAVSSLQPEVLYRFILRCGLEACGDLIALATPHQLRRVLDLDLWHAARPGRDAELDPQRFAVWVEVLMEAGAAIALQTLANLDDTLMIAGLAQHVRIVDRATVTSGESAQGDDVGGFSSSRGGPTRGTR